MTHRYMRMVGDKNVIGKTNRNQHSADRNGRIYLCRCFRQIKLFNDDQIYYPRMSTKFGQKRPYRSEYKIRN